MIMAQHGVVSAPNMAVGEAFQMGAALPTIPAPAGVSPDQTLAHAPVPAQAKSAPDGGASRA